MSRQALTTKSVLGAALLAALLSTGCREPTTNSAAESVYERAHREYVERVLGRKDQFDRNLVLVYGSMLIARGILLDEAELPTLLRKHTEFGPWPGDPPERTPMCRPDFARGSALAEHERCWVLTSRPMQQGNACRVRDLPDNACSESVIADGFLNDAAILEKLRRIAAEPCRFAPAADAYVPPLDHPQYGNHMPASDQRRIRNALGCASADSPGRWLFRIALIDVSTGQIALMPDDFLP